MNNFKFYINKFYYGNETDLSELPSILTRKFSKLDKIAISSMLKCYVKNSSPKLVFGSMHGQFDRLKRLTEQFKAENEVSPIAFSASVHNNTIGVFSLINKINSSYTALSAGEMTLASCICEAVTHLTDKNDVLLCCADSYDGIEVAVSAVFSLKPVDNAISVLFERINSNQNCCGYADFSDFLSGKEKYYTTEYFRLEKLC